MSKLPKPPLRIDAKNNSWPSVRGHFLVEAGRIAQLWNYDGRAKRETIIGHEDLVDVRRAAWSYPVEVQGRGPLPSDFHVIRTLLGCRGVHIRPEVDRIAPYHRHRPVALK